MKMVIACFLLLAVARVSAQQQMPQLPVDAEVRMGKLENGLTYYIRHNDLPKGQVDMHIAQKVGAVQEEDNQRGLAHFLEHMCFNGTEHFPGNTLVSWLETIGVKFGMNLNAATYPDKTVYDITCIPTTRESAVDSCLLILHDWADGLLRETKEIDKERGVIIEERRTRRDAGWRMHERSLPYYYGDSKYATCTLIGSQENLETFKPESLWNFYHTWYRPDLQAVIVVGDIDVDQIEQKIKDLWSDIPAVEDPTEKVMPVIPANEEPLIGIITDPEATSTSVQIISRQEAMPSEYNAYDVGMVMDIVNNLIYYMFAERYNDITSSPDAPFLNAYSALGAIAETCDAFMTSFNCKDGDAINAFKAVWTEIEKARRYGFTEGELERAKAELLSYYERAAESAETRENSEFVDLYITNFFEKYPYMEPQQEYDIAKMLLDQFDITTINMIAAESITENNLSIIYTAPEKEGLVHPTAEQFLAAIDEVNASDIQPNEVVEMNEPLMDASKLKGSKVKKTEEGVFGTTVWTLKNGIEVVVRPSAEKKDEIIMRLETDGGLSLVADDETDDMLVYSIYASEQGISKFNNSDMRKLLAGKSVSVSANIGQRTHGLSAFSTKKDLETAMQLVYLSCVDPRFNEEEYNTSLGKIKPYLDNMVNQPNYKLQQRFTEIAYEGNPRVNNLTPEVLENAQFSVIEKNYRMLFNNFKGARFYVFGDVDLETLKPLVQKYIGSLPVEKKPFEVIKRDMDLRQGTFEEVYEVEMETPKATALMVWNGGMPYSPKESVVMRYLNNCLDILYTKTIREDEGGTYGVGTYGFLSNDPKEEFLLQISWDMNPEMAEKLVAKVIDGIKDMAENGPTEEQYNMSKENFLKELSEDRMSNSWWLNQTRFTMRYGIDEASNEQELIESVTPADIQALAAKIVSQPNFISLVMVPQAQAEDAVEVSVEE